LDNFNEIFILSLFNGNLHFPGRENANFEKTAL